MSRWALAGAIVAAAGGCGVASTARAAEPRGVPVSQPLVVMLHDHIARTSPSVHAQRIGRVQARRPLTRVRTVLPLVGRAEGDGMSWLRVRLPGRPNEHAGWIPAVHTRPASTGWRIALRLSTRTVTVFRDGLAVRRFRAVIGKASTPTPRGQFFIEEAVALSSRDEGGPFALATSARSSVLQEFHGGPGQIALHGTRHLGDPLGTASSHGCIRLSTKAITWLARRIGAGVPVTIGH